MALKTYALTTVVRVSSYAGLTLNSTEESVMESIINSVSEVVEKYTGRRFKQTAYTNEEYTTERGDTLNLRHYPVASSPALILYRRTSAENEDDWDTVDSEYYHIDYDNGILRGASGLRFSKTTNGYKVTYTAGYDFDNATTFLSDTEAGDVELATWMIVASVWNNRKGSSNIKSEAIGDYRVAYGSILESEDIKALLDPFCDLGGTIGPVTPYQS